MAKKRANQKKEIEQYAHPDKMRVNNPPVGLVTPETDRDAQRTTYKYDPHLDPQLVRAGKAERGSFALNPASNRRRVRGIMPLLKTPRYPLPQPSEIHLSRWSENRGPLQTTGGLRV